MINGISPLKSPLKYHHLTYQTLSFMPVKQKSSSKAAKKSKKSKKSEKPEVKVAEVKKKSKKSKSSKPTRTVKTYPELKAENYQKSPSIHSYGSSSRHKKSKKRKKSGDSKHK